MNKGIFCGNCGAYLEPEAKFCQSCGQKTTLNPTTHSESVTSKPTNLKGDIYYSEDWQQHKMLSVGVSPYYDVMLDSEHLYLIAVPKYKAHIWGFVIGFITLNILGAAIGSAIGGNRDYRKRKWYRSAWLDSDRKLISEEYNGSVFLKLPLKQVLSRIEFKPKKFILTNGDKKIVFNRNKKEMEKLTAHINKHVL